MRQMYVAHIYMMMNLCAEAIHLFSEMYPEDAKSLVIADYYLGSAFSIAMKTGDFIEDITKNGAKECQ
ncbi:hypothetical protein ACFOPQ_05295 [Deinococcus antarcticus]|uniref:HEPN domain-containing protein n=1 Tax=Deinococcus antarcticus TaxID=1298767 RepID=A0ABV8A409_9DEIO